MYKLALLVVLVALSGANAFWSSCGGTATVRSVTSTACDATRCTATRGENLLSTTALTFTSAHSVLTVRNTAFVLGIGVPLPMDPPHDNACNNLFLGTTQSGCPTNPGVEYNWVMDLVIPATLPAFNNARVRFELLDGTTVVSCIEVTADLN